MWCQLEGEEIQSDPIELGDKQISPGVVIRKFNRFDIGCPIRYKGYVQNKSGKTLLFEATTTPGDEYMIAFYYIDKNTLLVMNYSSGYVTEVEELEIVAEEDIPKVYRQLNIFEVMMDETIT